MNFCVWCPMHFDSAQVDTPTEDGRGGSFTGWFLPDDDYLPQPHEHEIAKCEFVGCLHAATVEDGSYCSPECRTQDIRERGE